LDQAKAAEFKAHVILGIIVAFVVCLGVFVLGALKVHHTWPAFFIMIFFFLGGANVQNLPKIMIGAITGLLFGFLLLMAAVPAMTALGPTLGLLACVFVVIFLFVAMGVFIPHMFNDYAFAYFTIALIFAGEAATMAPAAIVKEYVTWGLTALLGGGGILACIIICVSLARKVGLLPPAEAGH